MPTRPHNPVSVGPARATATPVRVAMIQDGARRDYALPRVLHRAGALEVMYSEWFVKPRSWRDRWTRVAGRVLPASRRSLRSRRSEELADAHVRTNAMLAIRQVIRSKRSSSSIAFYHWSSRQVARWVARSGFGDANLLLGFIRNLDPELARHARGAGLRTVGDQIIAPARVEHAEMRKERARWPDWEPPAADEDYEHVAAWEENTWAQLDRVLCMSEYVRQGLLSQGVPAERVTVLPYPIDSRRFQPASREGRSGFPTVGFLGTVGLRKGAPYFLEVAKRLHGRARFVMVGGSTLDHAALEMFRPYVELIGHVPRTATAGWFDRFDIFLFPSTCEGSAGAVMEAMACGLPVVTTFNSGSLARDGVDGYIVPARDTDAMADRVETLLADAKLRRELGASARARTEAFDLDWYSGALLDVLRGVLTPTSS